MFYELAFVVLQFRLDKVLTAELIDPPATLGVGLLRSTPGVNRIRDGALAIAKISEQLYEEIVLLSGNDEMACVMGNFSDRTRFIRSIDLERPEIADAAQADLAELVEAVQCNDKKKAMFSIRRQFAGVQDRMQELVKEALVRISVERDGLGTKLGKYNELLFGRKITGVAMHPSIANQIRFVSLSSPKAETPAGVLCRGLADEASGLANEAN